MATEAGVLIIVAAAAAVLGPADAVWPLRPVLQSELLEHLRELLSDLDTFGNVCVLCYAGFCGVYLLCT